MSSLVKLVFLHLWEGVYSFLISEQVKLLQICKKPFLDVCGNRSNLLAFQQPLRGISILRQAIDKMQMNTNQLTSIHADLCQVRI